MCSSDLMLRVRNKHYGTVKLFDISFDDYSPEEDQGLDYKTVLSAEIFSRHNLLV